MPSRHRLLVPLTVEQLLTTHHLRVLPVADLEPCAVFAGGEVGAGLLLGYDALQVQLSYPPK